MRELTFSIILCQITSMVAKLCVGHGDWLYPIPRCPQNQTTLEKHRWDSTFSVSKRRHRLFGFLQQHLSVQAVTGSHTRALHSNLPFTKLPVVSQARLRSATTAAAFWWDLNCVLLVVNWFLTREENVFCCVCARWSITFGATYF